MEYMRVFGAFFCFSKTHALKLTILEGHVSKSQLNDFTKIFFLIERILVLKSLIFMHSSVRVWVHCWLNLSGRSWICLAEWMTQNNWQSIKEKNSIRKRKAKQTFPCLNLWLLKCPLLPFVGRFPLKELTDEKFRSRTVWAVAESSAADIDTSNILQAMAICKSAMRWQWINDGAMELMLSTSLNSSVSCRL